MTRQRPAKSTFHALGDTARGAYARKEMQLRSEVSMHWTVSGLCDNIYLQHRLKLVGWPKGIVFGDLSKTVTGLDQISILVEALNLGLRPHPSRDDIGRRRGSSKVDPAVYPPRHVRDGPKSSKVVSDEAEARAEGPEEPHELFKGGQLYAGPRPGRLHILN